MLSVETTNANFIVVGLSRHCSNLWYTELAANTLIYNVQHNSFLYNNIAWLVIFEGWFFLTRLKHLDDRIISLSREVWAHKISLTPPPLIEMFVPSQESERSCICVLGVSICSLSMIFLLDFGSDLTVLCFYFSFLSYM